MSEVNIYLDPSATNKRAPIIYTVTKFLVKNQGKSYSIKTLCEIFFQEYTPSLDTQMREITKECCEARELKLILAYKGGVMHPTPAQSKIINRQMKSLDKMAKSIFGRIGAMKYKISNDGQYKLQLGEYDNPIYEAYSRISEDEKATKKPRKYREPVAVPLNIADNGQMGFDLGSSTVQ